MKFSTYLIAILSTAAFVASAPTEAAESGSHTVTLTPTKPTDAKATANHPERLVKLNSETPPPPPGIQNVDPVTKVSLKEAVHSNQFEVVEKTAKGGEIHRRRIGISF